MYQFRCCWVSYNHLQTPCGLQKTTLQTLVYASWLDVLVIFGSAIQDVELSPNSSKKKKIPLGCNSTKTYIRKVFDYKTDAEICLPPKWVFWPCKYHSRLQKHFQWQSETHHELILMQIKEITRQDFWTVLSLYASRCYMFIPDPTKTIFKIEKVKTISIIYFSFRENRVQFLFKFSW